jgi:hypothetical protein
MGLAASSRSRVGRQKQLRVSVQERARQSRNRGSAARLVLSNPSAHPGLLVGASKTEAAAASHGVSSRRHPSVQSAQRGDQQVVVKLSAGLAGWVQG